MPLTEEYPEYDVKLSATELYLIDLALKDKLDRLGRERMILLDNGRMAQYEGMIDQTVKYELLLSKIRRKELSEHD